MNDRLSPSEAGRHEDAEAGAMRPNHPLASGQFHTAYTWNDASQTAVTTALAALRERWLRAGARVVLTNGCFDLMHVGHLRYLAEARRLGDVLVVALNDDESTAGLKGPGRPILPLAERAELLAAMRVVDAVLPFGGPTATHVVQAIRPDIYVKGGDYDWQGKVPPEALEARRLGAQVHFLAFHDGRSTSEIIRGIREPIGETRSE